MKTSANMPALNTIVVSPDEEIHANHEWAKRCRYWAEKSQEIIPRRKRREKQARPLILAGHGISIRVDKGCLLVRDGNTHYPASIAEFRYFRGELHIPTRIILIDGSGNITLGALDWMAQQGVHLIRLNWDGTNSIISNPTGYSANYNKVAWQLATKSNPAERLNFASKLIERKIKATHAILSESFSSSRSQQLALGKCENALRIFVKNPPRDISRLLGLEGEVAGAYFYAWRDYPLMWKSLNQYPVPDEWHKYRSRSALRKKHTNARATHPINAMLNYAYKALETQLRIQCIVDGYDPTIGILHHRNDPQRAATPDFVLDLMEPLRPAADWAIIKLVRTEKFSALDFNIQPDGVCRVNPQLARTLIHAVAGDIRISGPLL